MLRTENSHNNFEKRTKLEDLHYLILKPAIKLHVQDSMALA